MADKWVMKNQWWIRKPFISYKENLCQGLVVVHDVFIDALNPRHNRLKYFGWSVGTRHGYCWSHYGLGTSLLLRSMLLSISLSYYLLTGSFIILPLIIYFCVSNGAKKYTLLKKMVTWESCDFPFLSLHFMPKTRKLWKWHFCYFIKFNFSCHKMA